MYNNTNTMSDHKFYFKLAYTERSIKYSISPDKTLTDFINLVKTRVRDDFSISNNFDIELYHLYYNLN